MMQSFLARPLTGNELEVLRQLFFHGPTRDGDLVSKAGRDGLVERGLVIRHHGWQTLSEEGFTALLDGGYGEQKDVWERQRRSNQQ